MQRPLVLVSNKTSESDTPDAPRLDYRVITRQLDGDLLGYDLSNGAWYRAVRTLENRLKLDFVEAFAAYRRLPNHNVILSLSEKIAFPLALLFKITGQKTPHFLVGHKLSSGLKTHLFKLGIQDGFAGIICVSRKQVDYAVNTLGIPQHKVHFVHDKVDHLFFTSKLVDESDYILAVGQEQRDYATLLKAVAGTGIKLIVIASSPWSTSQLELQDMTGVEVLSRIPFTKLRDLYAKARLVVVPLHDVDYAAGVNGLLEAMSMGKATIITQTAGITDYVEEGQTAIYTAPDDSIGLRERILKLWDDAGERKRLGENARQQIVERINMDQYVQNIQRIIESVVK